VHTKLYHIKYSMNSSTWPGGVPSCPRTSDPQQYRLPFVLPGPLVIAQVCLLPTDIAVGITPVPKSTAILVLALPITAALLPIPCMRNRF
jgi:hypothetical protein